MSRELEKIEEMAKQRVITDPKAIDNIVKYIIRMPFSRLRKDLENYKRLRERLSKGFNIKDQNLDNLTFGEILILIGYEPGNSYFDTPQKDNLYSIAVDTRFIGAIFNNISNNGRDIHVQQFMHIGIKPFMDYLQETIIEEYRMKRVSRKYYSIIRRELKRLSGAMKMYMEDIGFNEPNDQLTVGDLISGAVDSSCESWLCCFSIIDEYEIQICGAYCILARFFIQGIRMSLLPAASRRRFTQILEKYGDNPKESYEIMDFNKCYEPHV